MTSRVVTDKMKHCNYRKALEEIAAQVPCTNRDVFGFEITSLETYRELQRIARAALAEPDGCEDEVPGSL